MDIFIRVNRQGNIEETISTSTLEHELSFPGVVNAYLAMWRHVSTLQERPDIFKYKAADWCFSHAAVHDRLGIHSPTQPPDMADAFPDELAECLKRAADLWLVAVPRERTPPLQRFKNLYEPPKEAIKLTMREEINMSLRTPWGYGDGRGLYAMLLSALEKTNSQPLAWMQHQRMQDKKIIPVIGRRYSTSKNVFDDNEWRRTDGELYPLAWAEISYCLENNISLKQCSRCGLLYPRHPNRKKYCSDKCLLNLSK